MASRNFVVVVKERGDGTPWLLVEPDEDIGLDSELHITMALPEGADLHEAQRVAQLINENLAGFRVKNF